MTTKTKIIIEELFEKIYQINFNDQQNVDELAMKRFEDILKENFGFSDKILEYSAELSEAERMMEEIFAEVWPDDQKEDIERLESEFATAEVEFEIIFNLYWE